MRLPELATDMRLLLVEDEEPDAHLARTLLGGAGAAGLELEHATTLGAALERLRTDRFDAVLLDLSLPDATGLDGLAELLSAGVDAPIVVLTGREGVEVGLEAVKAGAQDYLSKSRIDGVSLYKALCFAIERKRGESRLAFLAHHDPLTGLANRTLVHERIGEALAFARRTGQLVGLLYIDLDGFKKLNDTLGHDVGDELLRQAAERVGACVRETDTLGRLGGDEFVVLLPSIDDPHAAETVAAKVVDALARPYELSTGPAAVTASIGIAVSSSGGDYADALIANADAAMYEAKAAGRACYRVHAPRAEPARGETPGNARGLLDALGAGGVDVTFAPVVDVRDGTIAAVDALATWDREGRHLGAETLVDLAVEGGLLAEYEAWLLREAATRMAILGARDERAPPVHVRLSSRFYQGRNLADAIERALGGTGLRPGRLALDVPEGVFAGLPPAGHEQLRWAAVRGLELWIADFGAGGVALERLGDLPVVGASLSQALVAHADAPTPALRAAASVAREMELRLCARGVDSEAASERLAALGCHLQQRVPAHAGISIGALEEMLAATAPN